ncbi:hypothetical protein RI129_000040 [Pyrocoelia pectoralis]|uniref:Alkaline ceramidase n=1 Tax=Pyrocoelia pectoralis TaxID=417401 RepID=A0AAN7ZBI7_9COLE
MWATLEPGSSPIDWCEGNYKFSPLIAEFVNTVTNIIFVILPPLLIHLFRGYGQFVNRGIHIIWILLIFVGLSSAYFHATLSLIGQLLDEVAILWVFFVAFSMFYPRRLFPVKRFVVATVFLGAIATVLAIIHPAINAFVLMCLGIPSRGLQINFPYLHGLWHVFIFISSYTACVLFAYFSVKEEKPDKKATLKYWPKNDFELGIPYVSIKAHNKDLNEI